MDNLLASDEYWAMQIADWKKKYYRVDVVDSSEIRPWPWETCLKHSILKWRGLSKTVLSSYGFYVTDSRVYARDSKHTCVIAVEPGTCALCKKTTPPNCECGVVPHCRECILDKLCSTRCDDYIKRFGNSAWGAWTHEGNTEPMLTLLIAALKSLRTGKEFRV